jgi:hypothetical protein
VAEEEPAAHYREVIEEALHAVQTGEGGVRHSTLRRRGLFQFRPDGAGLLLVGVVSVSDSETFRLCNRLRAKHTGSESGVAWQSRTHALAGSTR